MKMKKGTFTMSQIAIIIVILVAIVLVLIFVTGQWEKLTSMFSSVTIETGESVTAVDIPQ